MYAIGGTKTAVMDVITVSVIFTFKKHLAHTLRKIFQNTDLIT